jgi:hypothetical protein
MLLTDIKDFSQLFPPAGVGQWDSHNMSHNNLSFPAESLIRTSGYMEVMLMPEMRHQGSVQVVPSEHARRAVREHMLYYEDVYFRLGLRRDHAAVYVKYSSLIGERLLACVSLASLNPLIKRRAN